MSTVPSSISLVEPLHLLRVAEPEARVRPNVWGISTARRSGLGVGPGLRAIAAGLAG